MGQWEGLTDAEIREQWPELRQAIYNDGVDLRRGVDGESFLELQTRVSRAMLALEPHSGETTPVVAHGGSLRSFISGLTKTQDSHAQSLMTPANTSVSHVALTERGPELLDYAVAAHLEALT